MATRRNFMKGGVSLAAVPYLGSFGAGFAQAAAEAPPMIARYFYDPSLSAGRSFADALEARGVAATGASGDWTALWWQEIDPIWRETPMAIAGLSPHGPMFMLENLANRHGMRLVFSASYIDRGSASGIGLHGLEPVVARCAVSAAGETAWATRTADAFLGLTGPEAPRSARVTQSYGRPATPMEDAVFAWVIAPVSGAARFV